MASANRCPECRDTIHPMAATCASCGADLDAHRRRQRERSARGPAISLPRMDRDLTDLVVIGLIMLLLALFAPLIGAILSLFIVWHSNNSSYIARRNIAIFCSALAIFDLVDPAALLPHILY